MEISFDPLILLQSVEQTWVVDCMHTGKGRNSELENFLHHFDLARLQSDLVVARYLLIFSLATLSWVLLTLYHLAVGERKCAVGVLGDLQYVDDRGILLLVQEQFFV